jgi:hypothetical protein
MVRGRTPFFTMLSAIVAGTLASFAALTFFALILAALVVVGWSVWEAIKWRDPNFLWALPIGVFAGAWQVASNFPGYVWVALLLILWMEWRLARLEGAIHSVSKAIRGLRRPRRARAAGLGLKGDDEGQGEE